MKKMMLFATFMVAFWAFQSCEDPSSVGTNIIPSDDAIQVDSIKFKDFIVNTLRDDSLYTGFRNSLYLGSTNKSNLGNATSAIYTEFSLNDTIPNGTNTLDSAVIYLRPSSFLGNQDVVRNFEVFTLQDSIPSTSNILINAALPVEQKIATISSAYSTDSITVNNEKQPFHLHGKLNQTFAEDLFQKLGNVKDNSALQAQFKGVKIEGANPTNGLYAITPVTSNSAISGIQMYFKDQNEENKVLSLRMSPTADITSDGYTAGVYNFNEMKGNYTNASLLTQLNNYNQNGYDLAAVDASNGIISQIEFPNLTNQFTGSETVNAAELVLSVDYTNNLVDTLSLPNSLFLAESFALNNKGEKTGALIGTDGSNIVVSESGKLYDKSALGFRKRLDVGKYTYTFFLPNYIERVKDGKEPTLLYITSSSRGDNLNGFTFNSSTDLELNIKYSKTN